MEEMVTTMTSDLMRFGEQTPDLQLKANYLKMLE